MTTTEKFQKYKDFYECGKKRVKKSTNPRYISKNFYQTHFTAGDEDQFQEYRDPNNGSICEQKINLTENIFSDIDLS